jgi:HK97 family phage major capsid protein
MSLLTTTGSGILTPEKVQELVVEPLTRQSVAMQASSVISTSSKTTRFPIVVSDPTTGWTAEGQEIAISDPDIDELEVTPHKLAGLTVVSSEMVSDSDPAALAIVGDGLVRDLQVKLDAAFFGTSVTNGPSGLGALAGIQGVLVDDPEFTNLDPFAEALSKAETVGATITSFVAHPAQLLKLSQIKIGDAYNQPLLGTDASSPTKRSVQGVPVYWSPAVDEDVVWAVPKMKSYVVVREDTSVVTDASAFFSSDRVGVRATMRVGFAWPHAAAIVKIALDGGS